MSLLKPMSAIDIKNIETDEILSRSTKNKDGTINVNGAVDLSYQKLKQLPLKFNKINGDFNCSDNQLTSLEGAPKEITGDFYCNSNDLNDLSYIPNLIHGDFICYHNNVKFTEDQVKSLCNVKGRIYV